MLQKIRSRAQEERGFTLIELLVVILIIGILAAIAIPAFLNQRGKSQDAAAKEMARTGQTTEETYYTDNQAYGATAALQSLETSLNDTGAGKSVTSFTADNTTPAGGYTITVVSNSGVTYKVIRDGSGNISRTCQQGSATDPGGCKITDTVAKTGTW